MGYLTLVIPFLPLCIVSMATSIQMRDSLDRTIKMVVSYGDQSDQTPDQNTLDVTVPVPASGPQLPYVTTLQFQAALLEQQGRKLMKTAHTASSRMCPIPPFPYDWSLPIPFRGAGENPLLLPIAGIPLNYPFGDQLIPAPNPLLPLLPLDFPRIPNISDGELAPLSMPSHHPLSHDQLSLLPSHIFPAANMVNEFIAIHRPLLLLNQNPIDETVMSGTLVEFEKQERKRQRKNARNKKSRKKKKDVELLRKILNSTQTLPFFDQTALMHPALRQILQPHVFQADALRAQQDVNDNVKSVNDEERDSPIPPSQFEELEMQQPSQSCQHLQSDEDEQRPQAKKKRRFTPRTPKQRETRKFHADYYKRKKKEDKEKKDEELNAQVEALVAQIKKATEKNEKNRSRSEADSDDEQLIS